MCTWCNHDDHGVVCPRKVMVAASSVGGPLARRWTDKTVPVDCPCARWSA